MKKGNLNSQEQFEVIELEKLLSRIIQLASYDPPKCIKNGSWKIDIKAVEKRMSSYRKASDGLSWIDWASYKNPKVPSTSAAYVVETLSFLGDMSAPTHIIVPGQNNCEGCDSAAPSKTEAEFASSLTEVCVKYQDKEIRNYIRKRTIAALKEMDEYGIKTEDDQDPSPKLKKKILQTRKAIRFNITGILNKNCS
jgi:hypothetical protein